MKIVVVGSFYSDGMGYTENCLPKALAALGHQVSVITSNWNIYGTGEFYDRTYQSFLGPPDQGVGKFEVDGYTVYRLQSRVISGYIYLNGLPGMLRRILPDVVHATEIAALPTFVLAAMKPFMRFQLYAESHQHLSVVRPFLRQPQGHRLRKTWFRATRTVPSFLASLAVTKCYAIAPDCADVAQKYYGVPKAKIELQSLGTDTAHFRPALSPAEVSNRADMRAKLGYSKADVVCIYTGRFSPDKNPLILARAMGQLSRHGVSFRGLFIGEGPQRDEIAGCPNTAIIPFMKHRDLADYYRAADIAVWPTQESMSMLDAASSGLPLVVSDRVGERDRVDGNGMVYIENDLDDLARVLSTFADPKIRMTFGLAGREKMLARFSWERLARNLEREYRSSGQDSAKRA